MLARARFLLVGAGALLLAGVAARAEHTPGVPGWQQDVHYSFSVSYAPQKFEIAGQETLAYWNLSPDTLSELYFHLYLNAYRPGSHMARYDASHEDWRVQDLIFWLLPDAGTRHWPTLTVTNHSVDAERWD